VVVSRLWQSNKLLQAVAAGRFRTQLGLVGRFTVYQVVIQAVGFGCGILIVRTLPKGEYALFTIAGSLLSAMTAVADSGLPTAVMALGGQVWQDRDQLGGVLNHVFRLRRRLGWVSALVGLPLLLWMLCRNGASWPYAALISGVVLAIFYQNLSIGLLTILPKLHARLDRIQKLELAAAVTRAGTLVAILPFGFSAFVATLASLASAAVQRLGYSRWRGEFANITAKPTSEVRARTRAIFRRAFPQSVFFAVYSQVGVWLISVLGTAKNVADLGALTRLAAATVLLNVILNNFVVPHYAKLKDERALGSRYFQFTALYASPFILLLTACALVPSLLLWVLGPKYGSLHRELLLMGFSTFCGSFMTVTLALNLARGWVLPVWNAIGIGLATQIMLIATLDLSKVTGVLWMNALVSLVGTLQNLWLMRSHTKCASA